LKSRLEGAFQQHNLDPQKYLRWLPWLSGEEFLGLLSQAHVFLDSLGFSGFNTAIQALHCRLPVVAYEGKFLRGRLASGVLRHLGLNELVVQDVDAYASVVTRLLNDAMWRDSIRKKISTQLPQIFNDESAIQSLQSHLVACVKK
jgi:protein O-GlcNAc transferase